ncbi:MAG TPA: hypothetical protein VH040_12545 [Usitatibacter sp.]|jgi:hypothetical protein|nr:hypothetical protein [Usitatibacter sp.]
MEHRALIVTLALGVALAGCGKKEQEAAPKPPAPVAQGPAVAQLPTPAMAGPKSDYVCKKNGKCEVAITIKDCSPNGIILDYSAVGVERGNTDIDIIWTIATDGYEFATKDGVKFKESDWQKEFKEGKANKNKYSWHDLNPQGAQQSRAFPYTVTIVKKGGAECASKDPTVINDI